MTEGNEQNLEQERIRELTNNYLSGASPIEGVRILSISKEDINGDFSVVLEKNNSIYILVADGVGHGLSAVMPGLHFPRIFSELVEKGYSLLVIASKLNDELFQYDHKGYFIALTLVEINGSEEFIEVLNCGNPSALLVDNKKIVHEFKSKSLACGILKNEHYEVMAERVELKDNLRLYVFTDGIQDSLIQSGKCENIKSHESLYSGNNIFDSISLEVGQLSSKQKMDDITLIEVTIKPKKNLLTTSEFGNVNPNCIIEEKELVEVISKCRILCIDPNKSTLKSLAQSLRQQVRNIDLCETLDETFSAYYHDHPDVIIIDISFLLENQLLLTKILPAYGSTIPIIVTSNPSNVIVAEQLFTLAIARYIRKPIDHEELINVIYDCISRVTQQKKFEHKSSVFLSSALAMTITDSTKRIIRVNDAFSEITGYTREEVIGCNPRLLSSGKHDSSFYQKMWSSINTTGHWCGEIWNKRKNGDLFLEWVTINVTKGIDGKVISYCSVFADITERKAAEEAMNKLSYYDDLTDLPNRRLFKEQLESELELAKKDDFKLAVLFLDLDNFKEVNDTLGHDYGDLVLKETAVRLHGCLHQSDYVSRMGGDEFTICITQATTNKIDSTLSALLLEMCKPFQIKNETIYLTISIGVVDYLDNESDVSTLLKNADQAMFYAKEKGRNRAEYFNPSMEVAALERKSLIQDLRQAIINNEFELYYQAIINMQTDQVYKAEALIRWHHPKQGLISPDTFIPLAENMGLIAEIGDWVFKQAVCQSKQWRKEISTDFQISINKSPKQFSKEKSSHSKWLDFMVEEECTTDAITVEITEGVLMTSDGSVQDQLRLFQDNGIKVSLDDFGTGYSSLAYLRKFHIDYIKIDREFVQNLELRKDDQALCEAIIVMAHALDIEVIAEGVETKEQHIILRNIDCDYAQGYYYSKPIPANQFRRVINDDINKRI